MKLWRYTRTYTHSNLLSLCFARLVEVVILNVFTSYIQAAPNEIFLLFVCIVAGMHWSGSLKRVGCLHYMLGGEQSSAGIFHTLLSRLGILFKSWSVTCPSLKRFFLRVCLLGTYGKSVYLSTSPNLCSFTHMKAWSNWCYNHWALMLNLAHYRRFVCPLWVNFCSLCYFIMLLGLLGN